MQEIKIRFLRHEDYCQELWEILVEEGKPRRYLLRDDKGCGTWRYASGEDYEPGFPTQDDVILILCDRNWNEQARTGNDRTRFPEFYPTLIDTCWEAWNSYSPKPSCCLDSTDFQNWLSTKIPTGHNSAEQLNWLFNGKKTIRREVLIPFEYCGDKLAIVRLTERHMSSRAQWRKYVVDTLNEDDSDNFYYFFGYECDPNQ